jgi:hypothetical protein
MKLKHLIAELQDLMDQGHGDKNVYYRGGAGNDCGELSNPTVECEVHDTGPFDGGVAWIELYAEQG